MPSASCAVKLYLKSFGSEDSFTPLTVEPGFWASGCSIVSGEAGWFGKRSSVFSELSIFISCLKTCWQQSSTETVSGKSFGLSLISFDFASFTHLSSGDPYELNINIPSKLDFVMLNSLTPSGSVAVKTYL